MKPIDILVGSSNSQEINTEVAGAVSLILIPSLPSASPAVSLGPLQYQRGHQQFTVREELCDHRADWMPG